MRIKRAPLLGAIKNTLITIFTMAIIIVMTGCSSNKATVEKTNDTDSIKIEQVEDQQLIENTEEVKDNQQAECVKPKATPKPTHVVTPKETPDVQLEETSAPVETSPEASSYTHLGNFKISAYCHCSVCCGKSDGITATGTKATANRTIAVDPNVIPLGSQVIIDGKTYVAEDTGGAIKGNRIDLYFSTHQEALNWGIQYKDVDIIV